MKNVVTTALMYIERHKKAASGAALVLAVVLLFAVVNSPAVVGASATRRSLPVYSVERDGKFVALSFDAAWGNEDTEQLIEILQKYDVTATFFLVGQWVDKYPESVQQLADAGMEVMNHSNDHAHFAKLSASEIVENINACNAKIEELTGVRPTLFRCPYGEYDDNVIETVQGMGMTAIQWDVDSLDWKGLDASQITERVVSGVKPGSIVLFHNAAEHTPEALPGIIEQLLADGYTIVPISELLLSHRQDAPRGLGLGDIVEQGLAAELDIVPAGVEVACVPGVFDVAFEGREVEQAENFALGVAAEDAVHAADVGGVHTYEIVPVGVLGAAQLAGGLA